MYGEFPDVVELNVGGTNCQTLLTTLTSEDGSELSAMFTGRKEVFKDKDGRYFIDAEWDIFKYILGYLKNASDFNFSLGLVHRAGGLFGNNFGTNTGFGFAGSQTDVIARIHMEAKRFGIRSLVKKLEQHQSVFVRKQIDTFQKKIPNFEETIGKILETLSGEVLLSYDTVVIQLCQDFQGNDEMCCEHTCNGPPHTTTPSFSFGTVSQRYYNIDTKVKVPYKMTVPVFKSICLNLMSQGFSVNGHVDRCFHTCKKPFSTLGGFRFGGGSSCNKELYIVQISWSTMPINIARQGLFGGTSQQQQQQSGFSFGSPAATGGLFGQAAQQSTIVGGSSQSTNSGSSAFGTSNNNGGSFGCSTVAFGSGGGAFESSNAGFGSAGGGSAFGSFTSSALGLNPNAGVFGAGDASNTGYSIFGSSSTGGAFGSSGNSSQPTNNGGPFGGSNRSGGFGTTNGAAAFGQATTPTFGGNGAGSKCQIQSDQQNTAFSVGGNKQGPDNVKQPTRQTTGFSFGVNNSTSQLDKRQSSGFTLGGGSGLFGNVNQQTSGFGLWGTKDDTDSQSKVTIAAPTFTFGTKTTADQCVKQEDKANSINRAFLVAPRKSQPVFGGPATFHNNLLQKQSSTNAKRNENISVFSGFGMATSEAPEDSTETNTAEDKADAEVNTMSDEDA